MSDAVIDANQADETSALQDAAREFDRARVKQIAGFHFAMVMGALTMWGAAVTWAQVTGWGLAHMVAVANAFVAAFVIASTVHEWGHFAGARMSGSVSPALEEPKKHFFMFQFAMDENDLHQFEWMSWGGILAPWVPVLVVAAFVPLDISSGVVLLAALIYKAASVAFFEVPIVLAAGRSGNPGAELGKQVAGGGLPRSRKLGAVVGAACFVLLWISA